MKNLRPRLVRRVVLQQTGFERKLVLYDQQARFRGRSLCPLKVQVVVLKNARETFPIRGRALLEVVHRFLREAVDVTDRS
jgi:hypothetical protein